MLYETEFRLSSAPYIDNYVTAMRMRQLVIFSKSILNNYVELLCHENFKQPDFT